MELRQYVDAFSFFLPTKTKPNIKALISVLPWLAFVA